MQRMQKKKPVIRRSTVILLLVFFVGLSLLLYPTFSDYWNSFRQTRAITSYVESVAALDDEEYQAILAAAQAYNEQLAESGFKWVMSDEDLEEYNSLLSISGSGIMGYIEIPSIDVYLPIYHGTDDAVLQMGVGHLEGSSLPIGGASTHTVISGHRGLPTAKLFTNLDKLVVGDTFVLYVLDQVLTYEVDQILIVEPDDLSALSIVEGQDYCTLVTCTPYGINTHRLLVRGHRIDTEDTSTVRVTADAFQIEPVVVAPIVAVPILIILLVVLLVTTRRRSIRRIMPESNESGRKKKLGGKYHAD